MTTYTVGGSVSGLSGSGLVLQNNAGGDLAVSAAGAFTFATELPTGAAYAVTVKTQPSSPPQNCVVTRGSGTVATSDVTNVAVACTTATFTIGGIVSDLTGSGLVLQNNGGDDLSISAAAPSPLPRQFPAAPLMTSRSRRSPAPRRRPAQSATERARSALKMSSTFGLHAVCTSPMPQTQEITRSPSTP